MERMRRWLFLHRILGLVANRIFSEEYKNRARINARHFSRMRKLGFPQFIEFILGNTRKSLQLELDDFMKEMHMPSNTYSKQAFSKQRQYIRPEAIQELFFLVSTQFYQMAEYETYRGYVVTAIDGSKLNLPDSRELEEAYGTQLSSGAPQNQALASAFYDVLNGIFLDVSLNPCTANERELAKQHFETLQQYDFPKTMVLMDRGYPSGNLIDVLEEKNLSYVIRCPSTFIAGMQMDGPDCVIEHRFQKSSRSQKLRILRFEVKEQPVMLATNILDSSFTIQDFQELYHLRWGIETAFDHLKNNAELENFSGITKIAVLQDFYASLFLLNIAQSAVFESKEEFDKMHNSTENKHRYKQNLALTIGRLKVSVVKMIACPSDAQRRRYFKTITDELLRCATPIRPGRSSERNKKHKSRKHHNGKKRVL